MTDTKKIELSMKGRIESVREKISEACIKAGRKPEEVKLIGVSKVFPVSYAMACVRCGLTDLGENRVQELLPKIDAMEEEGLECSWNLIGTLQKNKVKYIIGKTAMIHSVDTLDLAKEISKRSEAAGITTNILMQANISGEESKHGFSPDELSEAVNIISGLPGINLHGLMTMAPIELQKGDAARVFEKTYKVYESLKAETVSPEIWDTLSMGMSGDFEEAIACGSTVVRVGTAIFGDRKSIDINR